MAKRQQMFTWNYPSRLGSDVLDRLRHYSDTKFVVRLMASSDQLLEGEIYFQQGASNVFDLGLRLGDQARTDGNELVGKTAKEIRFVLDAEAQLLSGSVAFSYGDDVLTFSTLLDSDDETYATVQLRFVQYILEFLQTVGLNANPDE